MKSAYFQEDRPYSKAYIAQCLNWSLEEAAQAIGYLRSCNIVKLVNSKNIEYTEAGNPVIQEHALQLKFDFVGVIEYKGKIIKVSPKYIKSHKEEPDVSDMRIAIKAIERYGQYQNFVINISNEQDEQKIYNPLSIALYVIRDYFLNGIYSKTQEVLEQQGNGEIDWEATINETFPILQNGKPYYVDYFTKQNVTEDENYFSRLHECLITLCAQKIKNAELDTLFDIEAPLLYGGGLSDFGSPEYIKQKILGELNTQFVTQRQITLRAMYAILAANEYAENDFGVSFYGTNSFNMVWEKACADVFENRLDSPVCDNDTLTWRKTIKHPEWTCYEPENKFETETLRPDVVSIFTVKGKKYFAILDAKYYDVNKTEQGVLTGVPGVEDINKQHLYELALRENIESQGYEVINAFIFPSHDDSNKIVGEVKMPILFDALKLKPIKVVMLSPKFLLTHFIEQKTILFASIFEQLIGE